MSFEKFYPLHQKLIHVRLKDRPAISFFAITLPGGLWHARKGLPGVSSA
jgi:hypothetical protein